MGKCTMCGARTRRGQVVCAICFQDSDYKPGYEAQEVAEDIDALSDTPDQQGEEERYRDDVEDIDKEEDSK